MAATSGKGSQRDFFQMRGKASKKPKSSQLSWGMFYF